MKNNNSKKLSESIKNFLFKKDEKVVETKTEDKTETKAEVEVQQKIEEVTEVENHKINKETGIGELIEENPEMNDVLYEYGLYCGNCFAASFDTIEEGAKGHGLEDDEIEELIQELNKKIENKKLEKTEIK